MSKKLKILVTGGAGFIGSHAVEKLLTLNYQVIIIDNFDDFYSPAIKHKNLENIIDHPNLQLIAHDVRDIHNIKALENINIHSIIHLAAIPGVRKSGIDPKQFININIESNNAVIAFAQSQNINKIIFASSSSVYGDHPSQPWHEELDNLHPLSPYARYKLECEHTGETFASTANNQFISLRFFSVYGPRMRPDLAMYRFAEKIANDQPIEVYGNGSSYRDYTYIDDIIAGIIASIHYDKHGFDIFNLAHGENIPLINMISALEKSLDKKARCKFLPKFEEESAGTWADIQKAKNTLSYHPKTDFASGIKAFCRWYKQTHLSNV
ncbi:MAG: GDP-mannose 4,6-dehydratase [Candidatus Delongbacteria bacterium]|jgi:UDP-glucuronate 4-epimerase|nr:GDP-mannose 4,6-dehydratase [Candidatus Delongbacteria bacterium]